MAVLGFEGTLTIDGVTPAARNLRFGWGHTEVDVTSNQDEGNKAYAKGLFDKYVGAEILIDDTEAGATILEAVQGREPVAVSASLGDGITISGNMYIFGSEISTSLDDAGWISVTCRPAPKSEQTASGGA